MFLLIEADSPDDLREQISTLATALDPKPAVVDTAPGNVTAGGETPAGVPDAPPPAAETAPTGPVAPPA